MRYAGMGMISGLKKAAGSAFGRRRARGGPLQVAALPYRRRPDGSLEVLLVTTRGTGQWMVPKGWPISGKTLPQAAAQEAYEEAGVRGKTGKEELGRFQHRKTALLEGAIDCVVAVYPLAVEEELANWPERRERVRTWFGVDEAAKSVNSAELAGIIAALQGA
jgi:8-oxo-dGTP pyrophosphatase MutT (NUDIX family)